MAEEQYEERTLPATPRKREEARERGHVARSLDLSTALVLLAAVLAINLFGRPYFGGMLKSLESALGGLDRFDVGPDDLGSVLGGALRLMLVSLFPLLAVTLAVALASGFLQVGFVFSLQPLTPSWDRLDPMAGLQRIFSRRGFVRLLQGLLKIAGVAAVLFLTVWAERHVLAGLPGVEFGVVVRYLAEIVFVVSVRAALALLVLAILDYAFQRWQYEADLRMSRQEYREELKRYEGDPKIRERRRAIQRQLALQRMMTRVPRATVVVTNPTEISVALEYQSGTMEAPKVVAKGAGHLALRIREVALENRVPIVQRPEVARALYKTAEVGQTIPYELYQAVAEVLALVYRLKGMGMAA